MRYKGLLILLILLGIAVIILTQFSIPTIFEADGYLHIRMAKFIREYGLKYDFHWARYSTFAKNFADKDFLFHLLLIPFTFLPDMFFGAKVAATLFAIFLFLVFFLLLRKYSQKPLIPLFLVLFFCSPAFLQVLSRPRPMIFIIGLTLFFVHFLINKNQWGLFVVTIIYTLSHVSAPFLLVFALLGEGARYISEKEFVGRSLRTVALALALGFLVHPNFPNNFLVFYLNGILVPIYALKWGLELGAEFFPLSMRDFVLDYPFILIGLILLIAAGTSRTRHIKTSTKIWMSVTGFFFVFAFFSQRYIVHGYPLILISLAAYFSDWWQGRENSWQPGKYKAAKAAGLAGAILLFALIGVHTYKSFWRSAQAGKIYSQHYESVARWMARYIPAGEIIFHANWSDSQYLIGLNPRNDYFVTLDPIYMHEWDLRKYNLYREIAFGRSADPYRLLKDEFGVRYGYAGKNFFLGLIAQVRADPRFSVLAEDGLGLVFSLK